MKIIQRLCGRTAAGLLLSALVHAGLGGALYHTLDIHPSPEIVAELDLSMTSLLPAAPPPPPPPAAFGPGPASVAEAKSGVTWSVPKKRAAHPLPLSKKGTPKPEPSAPPTFSESPSKIEKGSAVLSEGRDPLSSNTVSSGETEEPGDAPAEIREAPVSGGETGWDPAMFEGQPEGGSEGEAGGVPGGAPGGVPGGVPEGQPGGIPGGVIGGIPGGQLGGVPGGQIGGVPGGRLGGVLGGSVGGSGRFLPASQVAQLPRWVGNLIGPGDYPRVARRAGKDGRVLLSVFIDETGRVRDVRLLQGTDDILNEVALRKVREAVFTPARSREGRPVPCKVTLPIRFQLQ